MAKQTTRWSPDTCSCVFEYTWDDAVLIENRVHKFFAAIVECPEHAPLTGEALFDAVLPENQLKNQVLGKLKDDLALTHLNADGSYKDGFEPSYTYATDRTLEVTVPQITALEKQVIETAYKTDLGTTKIIIK